MKTDIFLINTKSEITDYFYTQLTTSSVTNTSLNSSRTSTQIESKILSKFVFNKLLFSVNKLLSRYFNNSPTACKIYKTFVGSQISTSSPSPFHYLLTWLVTLIFFNSPITFLSDLFIIPKWWQGINIYCITICHAN